MGASAAADEEDVKVVREGVVGGEMDADGAARGVAADGLARIVENEAGQGEDGLAECPELFCAGAVSIGVCNNHLDVRECGEVLVEICGDVVGKVLGAGCFVRRAGIEFRYADFLCIKEIVEVVIAVCRSHVG